MYIRESAFSFSWDKNTIKNNLGGQTSNLNNHYSVIFYHSPRLLTRLFCLIMLVQSDVIDFSFLSHFFLFELPFLFPLSFRLACLHSLRLVVKNKSKNKSGESQSIFFFIFICGLFCLFFFYWYLRYSI
jgi:hypothetical protein